MVDGTVFCLAEYGGRGISVGLEKKLAGLAFWFKLQGCQDFTKDFWIRQVMKDFRRSQKRRDSRRSVSFELLGRVLEQLVVIFSSEYEVLLFKTEFSLAFFGAFQIGELVSPSKKVTGGYWPQLLPVSTIGYH